jgi:hypothetical protein
MVAAVAGPDGLGQRRGTDVEAETLGLSHGKLGGLVASSWGLPAGIPAGITHHHAPEDAPDETCRDVAAFVALGDLVAQEIGESCGGHDGNLLARATLRRLGLERGSFGALCDATALRLSDVLQLYEA